MRHAPHDQCPIAPIAGKLLQFTHLPQTAHRHMHSTAARGAGCVCHTTTATQDHTCVCCACLSLYFCHACSALEPGRRCRARGKPCRMLRRSAHRTRRASASGRCPPNDRACSEPLWRSPHPHRPIHPRRSPKRPPPHQFRPRRFRPHRFRPHPRRDSRRSGHCRLNRCPPVRPYQPIRPPPRLPLRH